MDGVFSCDLCVHFSPFYLLWEFVGVYKYTQRVGFLILATGVIPPGERPLREDCVKTHTIAQSCEGTLLNIALNCCMKALLVNHMEEYTF